MGNKDDDSMKQLACVCVLYARAYIEKCKSNVILCVDEKMANNLSHSYFQ